MGLSSDFARHISFVELLDVPTTGRTDTAAFWQLFNPEHAKRLDRLFANGSEKLILLSSDVIRHMHTARKKLDVFAWLPNQTPWGLIHRIGETQFHKVRHFSSSISKEQLRDMGRLVENACSERENLQSDY